jgi:hypothetical protein
MGKKGKRQYKAPSKEKESAYPSRFGSHESMVVENNQGEAWIACKDDKGPYVTSRTHLDSGLMDPYRLTTPKFRRDMVKKHFPHLIEEYDV